MRRRPGGTTLGFAQLEASGGIIRRILGGSLEINSLTSCNTQSRHSIAILPVAFEGERVTFEALRRLNIRHGRRSSYLHRLFLLASLAEEDCERHHLRAAWLPYIIAESKFSLVS